jgi:TonB family protein
LADKAVLSHVPIKEYGQLLIEQSIPGLKIGLVNHLIYSQLKKRINMMTQKKKSNKAPYLRYALSFSAFLLVFWTVSCQKEVKEISEEALTIVEQMPRFPGCEDQAGDDSDKKSCADQKLLKFIYDHIKYPEKAKAEKTEGMSVVRFVVSNDGSIKDAKIVRSVSKECDAEVLRIMQLMNDQEILWTPGKQKGKTVNVTYNLPIRFKLK